MLLERNHNQQLIPITRQYVVTNIGKFLGFLFLLGFYQSLLSLYPSLSVLGRYEYDPSDVNWYSLRRILSPAQWGSSAFHAGEWRLLRLRVCSFVGW
jgi:hypothetical protein